MSKRFKSQDYFRYPKLGKRWRKPVGLQSKLRLRKGGSGMHVAIGYGTRHSAQPVLVTNAADLEKDCSNGIIFSSRLGSKKTALLAAKAKEKGINIINMKKAKRAIKLEKSIAQKKESKKETAKKEQEKKEKEAKMEKKEKEAKTEKKETEGTAKKIGFDDDVVPQVISGKTKTYRLRDHELKVGDGVVFENTQKKEIFGHAKITKTEKVKVKDFNLKDPEHYIVYNSTEELMDALKKRNPERKITPDTEMFAYTYEFTPEKQEKKK